MPVLTERPEVERRVGQIERRAEDKIEHLKRDLSSVGKSRWTKVALAVGLLVVLVAGFFAYPKVTEEIAYIRAMQAYVYGFPLVMMDVTKDVTTATSVSGEYSAPMNQIGRMRTFVNPDFKNIVRISRNSLWSFGFLDLQKEPFVYSQPDTKGRYIVMQALNMWTDDFASAGSRTTGTGAGNFLIAGPDWNGTVPADITQTFRCSTRFAWVLVQMAAAGPQEFPEVNALQDGLKFTPLSAWGQPYTPPSHVSVDPNIDTTVTPFDTLRLMDGVTFFKRLARVMKDNPAYARDASMVEKLKNLGVEPGKEFDASKLDQAVVRGINRAPATVWPKLAAGPYEMQGVNGWLLMLNLGVYGNDYQTRAFIAYVGLGALTKDDAMYPSAFVDGDGNVLDGGSKYVMHFEKGGLPPSQSGVWSISQYRENFYVHNPIERYAISGQMPLNYNADGSLDVYIQGHTPGPVKEANWLPSPASLPFNLTVRVYQPKQEMLDGTYKLPPVRKVQ